MINYVNEPLFREDSIQKNITLTFSNGDVITNINIDSESMELTESLCSDQQLTYGACEASEFKITIYNTYLSHIGQTVVVSMVLDNDTAHPFTLGTYKVISDNVTADRTRRELVCYDALYDILNADVASWYNTLFPTNTTTKTLKQVRDSFFSHFGITQETVTLPNDSMVVAKTISPTTLSGKDVIKSICEINARFGHITRDNKFRYVNLLEMIPGLYPADTLFPANDLYPKDEGGIEVIGVGGDYISCVYEDFETTRIDKLVIRQEDTDIGCIVGSGTNAYIIQGNFLVFGKSASDLTTIANNIYSDFAKIWYRPADIEIKGNPCLEVGEGLRLQTTYDVVYTYILKRTLKGIQALRDTYYANGTEVRLEQVNSVNSELIQLKGKSAVLKKDIDEVSAELTYQLDDTQVNSYAYQTAQEIGLKVTKTEIVGDLNNQMSSGITITPDSITFGSTGTLIIDTTNFDLDSSGNVTMKGALTTGSTITTPYFTVDASGATFKGAIQSGSSITGTSFSQSGAYGTTSISDGRIETSAVYCSNDVHMSASGLNCSGSASVVANSGEFSSLTKNGRDVVTTSDLSGYVTQSELSQATVLKAASADSADWADYAYGLSHSSSSGDTVYMSVSDNFIPSNSSIWCGTSYNPFAGVAGVTAYTETSDRRKKKDIVDLDEKYVRFLLKLAPRSYKFIDGESGRTHVGFIAQEVEEVMTECGLTSLDFAGFIKSPIYAEDGETITDYAYALRYSEFISIITLAIQKQEERLNSLEERLSRLESEVK